MRAVMGQLKIQYVFVITALLFGLSKADAKPQWELQQHEGMQFDVIKITQMRHLRLVLNDQQQKPLMTFLALEQQLQPCEQLQFAMNAGMFHADFRPVGLYIENHQKIYDINTAQKGFGNFLIQPNGVLAWNKTQSKIMTTAQFQVSQFKARYATQSGPMLIVDGQINSNFLPHSDSQKMRNAVGMRNNTLYYVMTRQGINFYQFAYFLKHHLKLDQALYLDGGSVPSLYVSEPQMRVERRFMGPMFAYVNMDSCRL